MNKNFLVLLFYYIVTASLAADMIYSVRFLVFNILNVNFLNLKAVIIVKTSLSCDFKGGILSE